MNNQQLPRANSCLRGRDERTEIKIKEWIKGNCKILPIGHFIAKNCSFVTLPKPFRQCKSTLLIIHAANIEDWGI